MKVLSPKDLAQSLGVSESSVKRWVDDGAMAVMRTAGGHRRIALREAVRFVRQSGAAVIRPEIMLGARTAPRVAPFDGVAVQEEAERFFSFLQRDEGPAAKTLLLSLYLSGWPVAAICDGPMRVALERIGALWQHGPAGIVIEHRATVTCVQALAEMRSLFTPPTAAAPVALGAAPSNDPYIIPSMMAAMVLADLGYQDHNLGSETPFAALRQAIEHYNPQLVWLAMSVRPGADGGARTAVELADVLALRGATLVMGGRGAPLLAPLPGLLRIQSMAELAAFARGAQGAK